jgi:hypothetical protein
VLRPVIRLISKIINQIVKSDVENVANVSKIEFNTAIEVYNSEHVAIIARRNPRLNNGIKILIKAL